MKMDSKSRFIKLDILTTEKQLKNAKINYRKRYKDVLKYQEEIRKLKKDLKNHTQEIGRRK